MTRPEAIQLIRFEAFDDNGIVELAAAGQVCEFERFSKLVDAVEALARFDRTHEVIEKEVAGTLFHLNFQLSASIASWTTETYENNFYFAQLTQDLQKASEAYFALPDL